jgi:hypothetical protein
MTKIVESEALKTELNALVSKWKPDFGKSIDIKIRDILGEIIDKTNGAKRLNGLRSTAIYLFKKKYDN